MSTPGEECKVGSLGVGFTVSGFQFRSGGFGGLQGLGVWGLEVLRVEYRAGPSNLKVFARKDRRLLPSLTLLLCMSDNDGTGQRQVSAP